MNLTEKWPIPHITGWVQPEIGKHMSRIMTVQQGVSRKSRLERVCQMRLKGNSGIYPQSVKRRLEDSVLESTEDIQGREQEFVKLRLRDPHRML